MNKHNIAIAIIFFLVAVAAVIALNSCNGCKKPAPPVENVVDIIERSTQPAIDSLRLKNSLLLDSISKLNTELVAQKRKTAVTESNATATIGKLKSALASKDTGKIIVYSEDIANEFTAFKEEVRKQDSIQDVIIGKQAATIINDRSEIELHEQKYNLLKTAYQVKEIEANDWREQANKLDRKLKKKKLWNGVWKVGTAAGVGLAAFIFL
jgi:hypothetical protein